MSVPKISGSPVLMPGHFGNQHLLILARTFHLLELQLWPHPMMMTMLMIMMKILRCNSKADCEAFIFVLGFFPKDIVLYQ